MLLHQVFLLKLANAASSGKPTFASFLPKLDNAASSGIDGKVAMVSKVLLKQAIAASSVIPSSAKPRQLRQERCNHIFCGFRSTAETNAIAASPVKYCWSKQ